MLLSGNAKNALVAETWHLAPSRSQEQPVQSYAMAAAVSLSLSLIGKMRLFVTIVGYEGVDLSFA